MTDTPPTSDTLGPVQDMVRGTLVDRMEIELTETTPERTSGSMPVAGNTQPYGLLHGGASVVLAETLGSVAAHLHAQTLGPGLLAVGVDINATHHRSAREGRVHATATAVHRGRTSACYEVVVTDDAGRRICTSRITCAIRGQ